MLELPSPVLRLPHPSATFAPTHAPPLVERPPRPACEVCVIVPARNEAATIGATLASLAAQVDLLGRPLAREAYEVIVLANNCSDGTAAVARRIAARHPDLALHVVEIALPHEHSNVGHVRGLLLDEAYRRLMMLGRDLGVMASTDGDTRVAPDWIARTRAELACGVGAVGGRIAIEPVERAAMPPAMRAYHLRDTAFRLLASELESYLDPDTTDPWPRHAQHFCGSLAIAPWAYRRVGGLPVVAALEDMALYRELVRADVPVRHSPRVKVWTSARQRGRAELGLSSQLGEWGTMARDGLPQIVETADAVASRAVTRGRLRALWRRAPRVLTPDAVVNSSVRRLAGAGAVPAPWLAAQIARPEPFGLVFEQIEEAGRWPWRGAVGDVRATIEDLRTLLVPLRRDAR